MSDSSGESDYAKRQRKEEKRRLKELKRQRKRDEKERQKRIEEESERIADAILAPVPPPRITSEAEEENVEPARKLPKTVVEEEQPSSPPSEQVTSCFNEEAVRSLFEAQYLAVCSQLNALNDQRNRLEPYVSESVRKMGTIKRATKKSPSGAASPARPRRPLSGYFLFCSEQRQATDSKLDAAMLSARWKQLTDAEKEDWKVKASQLATATAE